MHDNNEFDEVRFLWEKELYIYIYIYMCVCVCVCVCEYDEQVDLTSRL